MQASSGKVTLTQRLRAFRWERRARRANHRGSEDCIRDPGAWFDADHYRAQWPGMAACSRSALLHHYRTAGWRVGSSPHRLFDPEHYHQACAQAGLTPHGNPIDHWLSAGQPHNLTPSPLADASWLQQQPSDGRTQATLSLTQLHPWGAAAEAVTAEPEAAIGLLASWIAADQLPLGGLLAWLRHTPPAGKPQPPSPCLAQLHPWGAAAEAVTAEPTNARTLLAGWLERGQLNPEALTTLTALPADPLPGGTWALGPADAEPPASAGQPWRGVILGGSAHHWQVHALLQHLPWPLDPEQALWCEGWPASRHADTEELPLLVLHLQPLELTNQQGLLPALIGQVVLDCRPEQVQVLRRLGVNAHAIAAGSPLRYPLPAALADQASSSLGLPSPAALAASGAPGAPAPLCLGSTGPLWERSLDGSCWCLPAFHALATTSPAEARQLAAWLQACQLAGVQLVELAAPTNPLPFDGFVALAEPEPRPAGWLPVQRFGLEITPAELGEELAWRRQGCPPPPPCPTPAPGHVCLWQHQRAKPTAAVCVSLHNYAGRITAALESVHRQTLAPLELIVVDDASSDAGVAVVRTWLEQHGHRFVRALLLQHTSNGGLASARNTAFAAAEAPWCFVLDADNALRPEAVERCLAIAQAAPASTAVVHPLIHLLNDGRGAPNTLDPAHQATNPPQGLLSHPSWQQRCFHHGNYVDAMALVCRSSWQAVGGYTHIPSGWEDYDFWCKLMEAGLHGVLCPQPLATYTMHGSSMTASTTARSQRPLSRWLQQRHPWLKLPMALEAAPLPSHRKPQPCQ